MLRCSQKLQTIEGCKKRSEQTICFLKETAAIFKWSRLHCLNQLRWKTPVFRVSKTPFSETNGWNYNVSSMKMLKCKESRARDQAFKWASHLLQTKMVLKRCQCLRLESAGAAFLWCTCIYCIDGKRNSFKIFPALDRQDVVVANLACNGFCTGSLCGIQMLTRLGRRIWKKTTIFFSPNRNFKSKSISMFYKCDGAGTKEICLIYKHHYFNL